MIRQPNETEFYLEKATMVIQDSFITRKDMFDLIQSLVNTVVYPNQQIKFTSNSISETDESLISTIHSLRNPTDNNILNGLISSNTDIQFTSLSANIYYLIELTKNTYDFTVSGYPKFEVIIRFLKKSLKNIIISKK